MMRSDILRSLFFVLIIIVVMWTFKLFDASDSPFRAVTFYTISFLYASFLVRTWAQMAISVGLYTLVIILDSQLSIYLLSGVKASESIFIPIGAGMILFLFLALVYLFKVVAVKVVCRAKCG